MKYEIDPKVLSSNPWLEELEASKIRVLTSMHKQLNEWLEVEIAKLLIAGATLEEISIVSQGLITEVRLGGIARARFQFVMQGGENRI